MRYTVTLDCRLDAVATSLSNYRLYSEFKLIHSTSSLYRHCLPGQHLVSQLQTRPPRDEQQALAEQVQPRRCCSRGQHSLAVEDKAVPKDRVPTHRRPQRRAVSVQQHICRGRVADTVGVAVGAGDIAVAHAEQKALHSSSSVRSFLLRSYCTSSAISALLAACGCFFPSQDRPAGQGDRQHVRQHTCGKRLGRIDTARCPWRRCPRCSLTIPKSSNEDQSLNPRRKIRISCAFRPICGKGSFGG